MKHPPPAGVAVVPYGDPAEVIVKFLPQLLLGRGAKVFMQYRPSVRMRQAKPESTPVGPLARDDRSNTLA